MSSPKNDVKRDMIDRPIEAGDIVLMLNINSNGTPRPSILSVLELDPPPKKGFKAFVIHSETWGQKVGTEVQITGGSTRIIIIHKGNSS